MSTASFRRTFVITLLLAVLPTAVVFAQKKPPPLPEFKLIEQAVKKQLLKRSGYRPGDVIARGDIKPVFRLLKKMDWDVAEQKEITKRVLPDRDFLILQLRTRKGVKFMRHLSAGKRAYDRLDRLRRMPYGKRRIRELIRSPGGYTLIQYMTGTRGGKNLGKQLSRAKNGRNFNSNTGRIYSERDLLKELKTGYEAEIERRKKKRKPPIKRKRLKRL